MDQEDVRVFFDTEVARGGRYESYLVTKTLRRDNSDFVTDTLVGFEVEG